ncbi:MAG: tRNA (adenosine(37)-N6)-threonylcarbamoyltransferase complex transferase subunit TsaD [Candidatus Liptonbacteria bacterium]|nr:tRNA (adenosine(37)-N6)-threonylcarbamoyltransferase complex transferase subunit TsaD [Candidatus Liptonbacteria bacterium]
MRILGIETSCDETGLALVGASGGIRAPKFKVLKNLVASQIKTHRPFGGVVPNLAKREHLKNLPVLYRRVFGKEQREKSLWKKIDLIAVTVGPGLEPALWTGINFAKELQKTLLAKPYTLYPKIIGVNHLEGHLYSFLLAQKTGVKCQVSSIKKIFPAIALIVSGGHTILLHVKSFSKWQRLGETRDDAAGEAFDKVARLLDLPYPGGPEVEKLSARGNPFSITFPRPMLNDNSPTGKYDFSFSGLKTSVLYYLRDKGQGTSDKEKADIAAGFEQAVVDVLVAKTRRAAEEHGAESIILSGGVATNKHLRRALKRAAGLIGAKFFVPDFKYNLDNAAMIAAAGYFSYLREKKNKLAAQGNLDI